MRLSLRSLRKLTLLAWLLAILTVAWVTSELVVRSISPERVAASFEPETNPSIIAQRLSIRPAMLNTSQLGLDASNSSASVNQSFKLVGVATGFGNSPGFALLRTNGGPVKPFMLGESITPETRLIALHPRKIEIERAGVSEIVDLKGTASATPTLPTIVHPAPKPTSNATNQR